jgi:hypothetical protein
LHTIVQHGDSDLQKMEEKFLMFPSSHSNGGRTGKA